MADRDSKLSKPAPPTQPTQDELRAKNLKSQETKALAKLERIKTWPKDHQKAAADRTQGKLNQIREAMKQVDKPTTQMA